MEPNEQHRHKPLHKALKHHLEHHKFLALLAFLAAWYIATFVLKQEYTGHAIEILGVGPAMDRVYGMFID